MPLIVFNFVTKLNFNEEIMYVSFKGVFQFKARNAGPERLKGQGGSHEGEKKHS